MACLALRLMLLLVTTPTSLCESKLWAYTTLDQSWLGTISSTLLDSSLELSFIQAAIRTSIKNEFSLVCKVPQQGMLQMNLIVVPRNKEFASGPRVSNLTDRDPSNILTAQSGITLHAFTPRVEGQTSRNPSNLLDGVYDGRKKSCYHTMTVANPYVVFNLGVTGSVKNVLLVALPDENALISFQNVDVRVGTFPTSENFSDYQRLGYMSGGAPSQGYVFMTDAPHPLSGQYLSVQAYMDGMFQVCHLEIYV